MMWETEIAEVAARHSMPADLIHAIVVVESGGDPWAIRFEPGFKRLYLDNRTWKVFGAVSMETEIIARATSWGLMQVMGQVARERGCESAFLSQLCKPETGLEYGCRQLRNFYNRFYDRDGWPGVVAAYNAGSPRRKGTGEFGNQAYVDKVQALWSGSSDEA